MTRQGFRRRVIGGVGKALLATACVALASCVPTVTYSPSPAGFESAQRALAAERSLTHPPTMAVREADPDFAPITFCTAEGLRIEIHNPRVAGTGICGRPIRLPPGAISQTAGPDRCWSFAEISSIGQPKDATAIGYYAVRGSLRCPGR